MHSGLPISDNWTFFAKCYGWGATGENSSKIGDFAPIGSLWPKISGRRGCSPPTIFEWIVRQWMPYNFTADSFHTKKLVTDFLQAKCDFRGKTPFCVLAPLGNLGATYDVHLRLIGKRVVDLLLVLIEFFFVRCYGWGPTSKYRFKNRDFASTGGGWPKISGRWGDPTNHSSHQKTGLNALSYGIKAR